MKLLQQRKIRLHFPHKAILFMLIPADAMPYCCVLMTTVPQITTFLNCVGQAWQHQQEQQVRQQQEQQRQEM